MTGHRSTVRALADQALPVAATALIQALLLVASTSSKAAAAVAGLTAKLAKQEDPGGR